MYSHQTCSITPLQVIIARMLGRNRDGRGLLENASDSMSKKSSLVIVGELFRGVYCIEEPSCETIEGQQGS